MPTRFEIHARDPAPAPAFRAIGEYEVKQVELFGTRRSKSVTMGYFSMETAINTVISWSTGDSTGWVTFRALEKWLSRIGSLMYFRETGTDWDPRSVSDYGNTTNPVDIEMEESVAALGKRCGHRPLPIAIAQVIDAYVAALEYSALLDYLRVITPEMLA